MLVQNLFLLNAADNRLSINPNVGEFWMLIDADWVSRWTAFALGLAGPPGPISNRRLFGTDMLFPSGPATEAAKGYPAGRPCENDENTNIAQ